ncbi:hypothetical protein NQ318_005533 [Aromia moschata]|uniref:DDE-1 domain-containing protein n=1 Tax=Aromia moschata TaxID=1265417 RepID=A0AAV8XFZ7_9CUCU|nr:hypothetical protein NQ318_005533 [Aromia moschata]
MESRRNRMYDSYETTKGNRCSRYETSWANCFGRKGHTNNSPFFHQCFRGNNSPCVYIPTKNMLKGAPIGTKGMANPSGWMTEEIFVESLKHFVNHVQPTVDKKALIIMDIHATHVQTGNEQLANGESFTISNICKSFEKTGIYPFNSNIFTDDDFLPSSITDRPDPSSLINDNSSLPSILQSKVDLTQSDNILDQPSTSSDLNSPSTSGIVNKNITKEGREELGIVSPEMVRPFPTAPPRKKKKTCGRKKGKCSVITDTPEKDELMKAEVDRKRGKKRDVKNKKNLKTAKKQCTSDSESDTQISLHDESPPPRDLEEYLTQLEQEHGSENEEDKGNCKKDDNSTCTICDGKYRLKSKSERRRQAENRDLEHSARSSDKSNETGTGSSQLNKVSFPAIYQLHSTVSINVVTCNHVTMPMLSEQMEKCWSLEEVPTTNILSKEETACEELFISTTKHAEDGRFVSSYQ